MSPHLIPLCGRTNSWLQRELPREGAHFTERNDDCSLCRPRRIVRQEVATPRTIKSVLGARFRMDTDSGARELILEKVSIEKGKQRFLERLSKSPTRQGAGLQSVKGDFERLRGEIEKRRHKLQTGRGNRSGWYK